MYVHDAALVDAARPGDADSRESVDRVEVLREPGDLVDLLLERAHHQASVAAHHELVEVVTS